MLYVLAVVLPPAVPLIAGKPGHFVLNVILTLIGWIPGVVHGLFIAERYYAEKREPPKQ